ncbi:helix-turn-helix domain-containing protein [Nocardia cyriacigeorgica]|uniref:helix-turn-helix domain-containing protein n=1 Tax=Nocardia cyriacigeorgica TaxID=135487 RepID=UPI0002F17C17|nr:helix-turn-helix transcriptional regulator [Nocardia cyriacigeorgica]MBF6343413.1 helix-turn-helix transcriptional regulator [Nocardia cyriacigeorgica]MBF6516094.1 helix-turn-helix transcriptional regulator [Nocardia cyriacigeorgica]TLF58435.1 helix-turn-helix transcriptional regulator [Nocardia cyriacigeorgica]
MVAEYYIGQMPTAADDPRLGDVIKAYMTLHGLATHAQMAQVLGIERSLVSKYVSGARTCRDITQLRHFADRMGLPPETFGLLGRSGIVLPAQPDGSVTEWRTVRQILNRHRFELTAAAAALYWDPIRIEGTTCITRPDWLAPAPVDLDAVRLTLAEDVAEPILNGGENETEPYRPQRSPGDRPSKYSQVIRSVAQPALFENRTSYRLTDATFDASGGQMTFGLTTYFDMVDVCEAMAHETAHQWVRRGNGQRIYMEDLPFRQLVGDLFDTRRRAVLPSINTLTIRRAPGGDTFFLHRRDSNTVTLASGLTHIVPAGVFQPAAIGPWNVRRDFSLWRNMLREFFEELLDAPEHDGSRGTSVDYDCEPFRALTAARETDRVRAWCFGVGFDPLAPAGEILTTVVIDASVFDEVFAGLVSRNSEGDIYPSDSGTIGIRWNAGNVRRVLNHEPLAAAAAACIALTWRHRGVLLP